MEFIDPGRWKRKIKIFGSLALAVALLAGLIFEYFESGSEAGTVLGDKENVIILTAKGPVSLVAKLDTGADFSSIDSSLAASLGLPHNPLKRKVLNAQGVQVRDTANIDFIVANQEISSIVSLADRSQLSTDMIIGRSDMQGFTIDPNRQFLNEPKAMQKPTWQAFFIRATNRSLNNQLIILPILGAIVVICRLIFGIKTFGIFAPVVIALSLILMQPNIGQGVFLYLMLISVGVALKLLLLSRLRLPNVAEMALSMAFTVLVLVLFSLMPLSFQLTVTTVFFPLIITTHIVESFSRAVEDQKIISAIPTLLGTIGLAVVLAFIGLFLLNFPITMIWTVFFISVMVVFAVGNYTGLRLSELVRFNRFIR